MIFVGAILCSPSSWVVGPKMHLAAQEVMGRLEDGYLRFQQVGSKAEMLAYRVGGFDRRCFRIFSDIKPLWRKKRVRESSAGAEDTLTIKSVWCKSEVRNCVSSVRCNLNILGRSLKKMSVWWRILKGWSELEALAVNDLLLFTTLLSRRF